MTEVRRTRARPSEPAQEEVVVRRTRQREKPSSAGMTVIVPSAEVPLMGYADGETVEIAFRVKCRVINGNMQRGDLENWFRHAVFEYHNKTNGVVGYGKLAKIARPLCARIDKLSE